MEVIKWKENKEVGFSCFEVRNPMKKTYLWNFSEKEYLYLDSTILFWKKTKIFMEMLLHIGNVHK